MKFHIFASNKGPNFKCKLKDDITKDSSNFLSCESDYNNAVLNSKYTDVYFVCDFGLYKEKTLEYASIDENFLYLPYMIIDEWHIDNSLPLKCDNVCIKTDGFREEFKNNKSAIEKFIYYIENKIQAEMYTLSEKDPAAYNKYIADVLSILTKNAHDIKRYNFDIYK